MSRAGFWRIGIAITVVALASTAVAQQQPTSSTAGAPPNPSLQVRAEVLMDLLSEARWAIIGHRARLQAEEASLRQELSVLRAQQPGSQVDQLRAQTERHRQEASAAREQEATAQRQLRAERAALDAQIARFAPPAARVAGPATIVSARRISVNGREVLLANINDFRVPPFPMLREALQALGGSVECIETNSGENLFNCRAAGRDLAELFVLNGLAIVAASTRPELIAAGTVAQRNNRGCWGPVRCW